MIWSRRESWIRTVGSDAASGDLFSRDGGVAVSSDWIAIGAWGDDDGGSTSGSVYLYEKPVAGWGTMTETLKRTASDAAVGDYFGFNVAIDGDTILVGAYQDDDGGSGSGSVYVLGQDEGGSDNWGESQKITAEVPSGNLEGNFMLNEHRARFAEVVTGRWITEDPIEYYFSDSLNLYESIASNPIRWFDPSGLTTSHWHHDFPQAIFRGLIEGLDIDDPKNGTELPAGDHVGKNGVHPEWDAEWRERIRKAKAKGQKLTKQWAEANRKAMKEMEKFKDKFKKGKTPKKRFSGTKNGPPRWKARRAKTNYRRIGAAAGGLLGMLGEGKAVADAFGGGHCRDFLDQLSRGTVNQALCMDCAYDLGEAGGHHALNFERKVCCKLPPDGDYPIDGAKSPGKSYRIPSAYRAGWPARPGWWDGGK